LGVLELPAEMVILPVPAAAKVRIPALSVVALAGVPVPEMV